MAEKKNNADSKFGEKLMLSFHEQFAENQNHHQKSFLQVLALLITVLVGFGYLYVGMGNGEDCNGITRETIYIALALSMVLLSLAMALIVNMAYGFRRDQSVACRIRLKGGVMEKEGDVPSDNRVFPKAFNPVNKSCWLCWMPGFHNIFFIALFIIKLILLLSVLFGDKTSINWCMNTSGILVYGSAVVSVLSFFLDGFVFRSFWKKWEERRQQLDVDTQ